MSIDQRRSQMRSLLARRRREGLTYEELSAESGIPAGTLASWQSRLKREGREGVFTELVAEEEVRHSLDGALEVIGPCGHRVMVPSSVEQGLLERVLKALPC